MAGEIKTKEDYAAFYNAVKANRAKMSDQEYAAAVSKLADAKRRFTAEAAAKVEAEAARIESARLAERPLSITGEPPQDTAVGNFDETRMLFAEGVKHGLWQMWQGTRQLGKRIEVMHQEMMHKPSVSDQLKLTEMQIEYGKAQDAWKARFVKDAKAINADPTTALLVPTITSMGVEALALAGPVSKAATTLSRVATEGGLAALGGALQPTVSNEQFLANTITAGIFGTGVGGLFWAVNLPANATRRSLQTGRTGVIESLPGTHPREVGLSSKQALEHEILAKQFDPNLKLTPAMLSQNEAIAQMERQTTGAPGSLKAEALQDIEDVVFTRFTKIADALNPNNVKFPTIVAQTKQAMVRGRDALAEARRTNWTTTMDQAVKLSGGKKVVRGKSKYVTYEGGVPIVEATSFFDTMKSLVDDAVKRKLLKPEAERDVMKFYNRWAERIDPHTGRMTAADSQRLLVELTDEMGGVGSAFGELKPNAAKRWASTLKDSVLSDLDSTIAKRDELERLLMVRAKDGKPRVTPDEVLQDRAAKVAALLKRAREDYAEASAGIETFEAKGLWRMLHNLDQNNESWYDKVMSLPPDEMREFLTLADSAQAGLANAIRGRVLADAFERNLVDTTFEGAQRFDLHAVLTDLNKGKNGVSRYRALFPKGAYSDEEMDLATKGLKVLQLITKPRVGDQPTSFVARMREAAINVISRSPEFFGRWVFGEIQPMQLEKMLYSDDGVRALMEIGRFQGQSRMVLRTHGEGLRPRTLTQAIASFAHVGEEIIAEEQAMEDALERHKRLLKMAQESPQMVK